MERHVTIHGMNQYCRNVRVKVKYDETRILNPRAVAASSLIGWGSWQSSHRIDSKHGDCFWCTTAGHGGYILVATQPITFAKPALEQALPNGPTLYVYEFEEDCEWANLLDHDEVAAYSDYQQRLKDGYTGGLQAHTQAIQDSILWSARYEDERRTEARLLDSGAFLRCCASTLKDGRIHVLFKSKNGARIGRYMAKETYDAIPLGTPATPEMYAQYGAVEAAPSEEAAA